MRKILEVPVSTPNELLYLETGNIPILDIIKSRRIMYLHYLLTSPQDEMLFKVFKAMMREPTKGDWIEIVKKDLNDYKIHKSFDEIKKIKVELFKKKVAKAGRKYSFSKLINEKEGHKKGNNLKYNGLKMQKYLISDKFTTKEAKFLFKIRTNMLDVKANFKQKFKNDNQSDEDAIKCDLCFKHIDDQEKLLFCEALNITENVEYKNLFSANMNVAAKATRLYRQIWKRREGLKKSHK